jgi:hypothetical protein
MAPGGRLNPFQVRRARLKHSKLNHWLVAMLGSGQAVKRAKPGAGAIRRAASRLPEEVTDCGTKDLENPRDGCYSQYCPQNYIYAASELITYRADLFGQAQLQLANVIFRGQLSACHFGQCCSNSLGLSFRESGGFQLFADFKGVDHSARILSAS